MERTEIQKFETKVKAIRKQIRTLAASSEGDNGPSRKKIIRAIEGAYDLSRFVDDGHEIVGGLIAARRFAERESQARRVAEREAEIARLSASIRESERSLGGYEKELKLARLGVK
jgi:hypothetical protein